MYAGVPIADPVCVNVGAPLSVNAALTALAIPKSVTTAVSPGVIESRWLKDGVGEAAFASVRDRYADSAVLGRVAQPEDVAEPAVWLLEGADYITGEILMVDGGVRLTYAQWYRRISAMVSELM